MKNVLLISPRQEWLVQSEAALTSRGYQCLSATKGKDAQLKVYKGEFNFIFLDLEVTEHAGIEVFSYLRKAFSSIKVFVMIPSSEYYKDLALDEERLFKMGAAKVLVNPDSASLFQHLMDLGSIKKWETIQEVPSSKDTSETEAMLDDGQFTRILISELLKGVLAVTDFFIRLGTNRYVKIIHQGERASLEQLQKYSSSGVKYLYFETKDRMLFIGHQNDVGKDSIRTSKSSEDGVMKATKLACDKFIEEVYTIGIHPHLLEEGKQVCQNMYEAVKKNNDLKHLLSVYDFDPTLYSEAFLVALFSTIISRDLPWVGAKTVDTMALGALLHDIGKIQLEESLLSVNYESLPPDLQQKYQQHPQLGADAIKGITGINQGVISIVLEHHESISGSGYPAGLTNNKIFPLAKVVGLADGFAEFLKARECSPLQGLKTFLSSRETITRYEPDLIRNLIKGIKG